MGNNRVIDFSFLIDEETAGLFKKIAAENGTTAKEVLSDFIKDYVVSGGHPEQVINRWPWNRQD